MIADLAHHFLACFAPKLSTVSLCRLKHVRACYVSNYKVHINILLFCQCGVWCLFRGDSISEACQPDHQAHTQWVSQVPVSTMHFILHFHLQRTYSIFYIHFFLFFISWHCLTHTVKLYFSTIYKTSQLHSCYPYLLPFIYDCCPLVFVIKFCFFPYSDIHTRTDGAEGGSRDLTNTQNTPLCSVSVYMFFLCLCLSFTPQWLVPGAQSTMTYWHTTFSFLWYRMIEYLAASSAFNTKCEWDWAGVSPLAKTIHAL